MKRKVLAMLLALALVFTLAACGPQGGNEVDTGADTGAETTADDDNGDDDDDASDAGADAGGNGGFVQGVTDDRVYIGNTISTSGALAVVGVPFQAGILAYIEMVNSRGGVHGREIVYIHYDDEWSPERALAFLEGLINDDEVFAIVGQFGTPIIGATFRTLVETGIPTVYFAAGTGIVYNENATDGDGRNTFPIQPVFPMEGRVFAAWAAGTFDAERIGVIYTSDDAGEDLIGGIRQEAAVIGGLEIFAEQVAPGADDVTAAVASVLGNDVDVVIIASIQGTFSQIANELANQGNTAPTLTTYVNVDRTQVDLVADTVWGQYDIFGSSWVDMSVAELDEFQEWIAVVSDDEAFLTSSFAITGWIAMHAFIQGLERVEGELTWDSFIHAMESAPIANPFGSAIDFSGGSRVGTQDLMLWRLNPDVIEGWELELPFMSMDEILGE